MWESELWKCYKILPVWQHELDRIVGWGDPAYIDLGQSLLDVGGLPWELHREEAPVFAGFLFFYVWETNFFKKKILLLLSFRGLRAVDKGGG